MEIFKLSHHRCLHYCTVNSSEKMKLDSQQMSAAIQIFHSFFFISHLVVSIFSIRCLFFTTIETHTHTHTENRHFAYRTFSSLALISSVFVVLCSTLIPFFFCCCFAWNLKETQVRRVHNILCVEFIWKSVDQKISIIIFDAVAKLVFFLISWYLFFRRRLYAVRDWLGYLTKKKEKFK